MSIELAGMVEDLQEDVPQRDSYPSDEQYGRAVKDAVADFSNRAGTEKIGSLSILPGTETYDLADDFLKMIMLESFASADGVLISAEGIIPLTTTWDERYWIRNRQITFNPEPSYTMTREYRYKAAWILDEDDAYQDLTSVEVEIILKKAASVIITKQANKLAPNALSYTQGDVKVELGTQTLALRAQAEKLESDYLSDVEAYVGQYGTLGGD